MKMVVSALVLTGALAAAPALAGGGERQFAAYEACVTDAAVRASYTDAAPRQIVETARMACADARTKALRAGPQLVAAADVHHVQYLTAAIDTLRDRRRTADALYGVAPLNR